MAEWQKEQNQRSSLLAKFPFRNIRMDRKECNKKIDSNKNFVCGTSGGCYRLWAKATSSKMTLTLTIMTCLEV